MLARSIILLSYLHARNVLSDKYRGEHKPKMCTAQS